MNKIYLYLFFIVLLLRDPIQVSANLILTKDLNNSIEINQQFIGWDDLSQRQPTILFESGIYRIWYASFNGSNFRIVYGESRDLKNIDSKQLINLNYDETYDIHDPSILKINNKYELYFAVSKNETSYKILKAVSNDGINFDEYPVEILNTNLPWNNKAVSAPSIFFENNQYYLFFTGWNGSEWKLGLSTSTNGTDWINCNNNPIVPYASGPTLIKKEEKYLLFFHSSNASNIESVESNEPLTCSSNWTNRQLVLTRDKEYDTKLITDPNIIDINNSIYLIYGSLSLNNIWTLNIAKNYDENLNKYIVFIPGFMTSWNKNALIYNLNSSIYDWKILDFVKEYDGLLTSLNNKGYITNDKLYIFAYDWRKPLEDLSENLESFIQNKILSKDDQANIYIVSHSFGGLVGRIYLQKYPDNIKKLITVGTPHKGTAKVYNAVQAGNVDSTNDYLSLAQNLILNLNRSLNKTDKEIVLDLFPSLLDIYPIYDFLYDSNDKIISTNSLKIKNNNLLNYNNLESIQDKFYSLYSDTYSAIFGYKIKTASPLNEIFDRYNDGEPIETKYASGDKNLIAESTNEGDHSIKINGDHEEIIFKKNSIAKILDLLNIDYDDSDIVEGNKTVINPSLIFIIKSPAVMEVKLDDKFYYEKDGLIFIPNASSGKYSLKVQGTGYGNYTILVGQISQINEIWEELNGEIKTVIPSDQIDFFEINYNNQQATFITKNPQTPSPTPTIAMSNTSSSNISNSESGSSNTSSSDTNNTSDDKTFVALQNNKDSQIDKVLGASTSAKNKKDTKLNLDNIQNGHLKLIFGGIFLLLSCCLYYFYQNKMLKKSKVKLFLKKLIKSLKKD